MTPQAQFEKARRDWLGPDLTDAEARKLIAATEAEAARRAKEQRGADR